MANDKSDFVDLISQATQQHWRRPAKRQAAEPEAKPEKKLSNWPPERMDQWRLINLTPWKMTLKPWKFKDWV